MNFDNILMALAIFLWFVLCGIVFFVWYDIIFDEDDEKPKQVKKTEPINTQPVVPTTKLRFKKPDHLNI